MDNKAYKRKAIDKNLIYSMAAYSGASVVGPLILFGLIGWWLDKTFQVKTWFLLGGVFIAFIFTNILIWRQAKIITLKFKELEKKDGVLPNPASYDEEDKWPNEK